MAKKKKSTPPPPPQHGKVIQVRPYLCFRHEEIFIPHTFYRVVGKRFLLTEEQSKQVFEKALESGIVVFARNVYPGIPTYKMSSGTRSIIL